jgi:glycosyltransferase involved in cell wall biosynthesis
MDKISIIIPCYNEQEALHYLYSALNNITIEMENIEFEFIFVNDGSTDRTLDKIIKICKNDRRAKYLSFSKNFGKEAAMYAGLKNADGDYIAIIDSDMQDPPDMIPIMYKYIIEEGYDCVAAYRKNRVGEPLIRTVCAKCFYKIINLISDASIIEGARDFRLMKRQMVQAILSMGEYNRFSKGIFGWVGFNTKWIEYPNNRRIAGETKWSLIKLIIYATEGIVAFSTKPLALASVCGLVFCLIAFIMICVIVVKTLIFGDPVSGWPSLICAICLIGGVQLFCTGILGQYLAKSYLEAKKRPIYIIKESNFENNVEI